MKEGMWTLGLPPIHPPPSPTLNIPWPLIDDGVQEEDND